MRERYLVGVTQNKELVFAEIDVRKKSDGKEFAASFNTVAPFNTNGVRIFDYYNNWCADMEFTDKSSLYDMCDQYDCSPSELPQKLADDCYDIEEIIDCSLYPEVFNICGDEWRFESMCCGQHDTRNEMAEYVNKQTYDIIHELWDTHHLKQIDDDKLSVLHSALNLLLDVNEEEWIIDYIERVIM